MAYGTLQPLYPAVDQYNAEQRRTDKIARLKQIRDAQRMYPGRAPGGMGVTGLMPNDARGWSSMLGEQTEGENIQRELSGKGPLAVEVDPVGLGGMPPSLGDDPEWWAGQRMPTSSAELDQKLQGMPASLRGLYIEGLRTKSKGAKG